MMDLAPISLGIHGPLSVLAFGALFKLSGESPVGGYIRSASDLANKMFDQLSGELESVLSPLVEENVEISRVLVDVEGRPLASTESKLRINETFRNALDDYLTRGREFLTAYRDLRCRVERVNSWCKQLRRFTALTLIFAVIAALVALVDTTSIVNLSNTVHLTCGVIALGSSALWVIYAVLIFLEKNPIADLETKYAYL